MKQKPPHPVPWLVRLLKWFCPEHLLEGIIGDLQEQYEINRERGSKFKADWLFISNLLQFAHFEMIRRKKQNQKPNSLAMLTNYLLIALRNLRKHKQYHLLNFLGLTLGLSCCALVLLYADHEFSYDSYHPEPGNTYRVTGEINYGNWFPSVMTSYADQLIDGAIPEIKSAAKFRRAPNNFAIYGENRFATRAVITAPGSNLFDLFNFNLKEGNPDRVLSEPNTVVFTESTAKKVFGEGPYTEKVLAWDSLQLKVSGVIEDLPTNTHLKFNMLVIADIPFNGVFTYITLNKGADPEAVAEKIQNLDSGNENYFVKTVKLQPLESIHLDAPLTFELKPPGNKQYIYLLSLIALFILVISSTNYMNLSAAIYTGRRKEMAVRKVFGGSRKGLAAQFLLESMLMTLLTLPFVLLIVHWALPAFGSFVDVPLDNAFLYSAKHILLLVGVAALTGLISGMYPILTMSNFSALRLFRKETLMSNNGLKTRKILLTLQFTILLTIGTGAYLVNKQLHYIQQKDLGIEQEAIIKVKNAYDLNGVEQYNAVKRKTLESPHILGFTTGIPPGTENYGLPYKAEGHEERRDALSFSTDPDYFKVMGIDGLYGDFFDLKPEELPNLTMLVNQQFVDRMGWEDPIGKKVSFTRGGNTRERFVGGVFNNYHNLSLHHAIAPQFIFVRKNMSFVSDNILIRIETANVPAAIKAIEDAWYSILPDSPIICEFMNEDIEAEYKHEKTAGILSLVLSILAVSLSAVGLIGLGAYMAELRNKEIGIRRVLGASIGHILTIMNREYLVLIIIASMLASTITFFAATQWLDSFAFRTNIPVYIFPIAAMAVGLITSLTISWQSGRTIRENPVNALRHE